MDNPKIKHVLAFLAGLVSMQVIIMAVEYLGHMVYPPPEACRDFAALATDPAAMIACQEAIAAAMPDMSVGELLFPIVAWFLGTLGGGLVAARLAPSLASRHIWILGALTFLGAVFNLMQFGSPVWVWVLGLLAPLAGAWLAVKKSA